MFVTMNAAAAVTSSTSINTSNNLMLPYFPFIPTFSSSITTARHSHYHHHLIRRCSTSNNTTSTSFSLLIDNLDEAQTQTTTITSEDTPPISESSSPRRRRLILLRHAKSSLADPSLRDHNWPLDEAGEADTIKVSQRLHQLGWIPELILCSDALRTRDTLKFMQDKVREFSEAEVHFIPSFYSVAAMDGQTAEHLQEAICKYSRDEILTVMCMGHNRGWEEAASMLSGASVELMTCNVALLEGTGKSWEEAFSLAGLGGWKLWGIVKTSV